MIVWRFGLTAYRIQMSTFNLARMSKSCPTTTPGFNVKEVDTTLASNGQLSLYIFVLQLRLSRTNQALGIQPKLFRGTLYLALDVRIEGRVNC